MRYSHSSSVAAHICSAIFFLLATPAISDDSADNAGLANLNADPLLFSDFHTYNPLKNQNNVTLHKGGTNLQALSNEDLIELADNSRHGEMSASQRALNQQWLAQHGEGADISFGGQALQKIIQQGFKTYWDALRQSTFKGNTMIPDSEGNGSFGSEMEYKLRLSDDKVKLAFEYSF
tara:strand:+ start:2338 stop:2868 length:531 start_codon:yes stop_codon:yes gene_type:complete